MKHSAAEAAIDRSATGAERGLAWFRIVGYTLDLPRVLWLWLRPEPQIETTAAALTIGLFVAAMAFSSIVLWTTRSRIATARWRLASVALDMVLCTLALAALVLWPTPDHAGLFARPDPYFFLLLVMLGSFRLSGPIAAAGGLIAAAGVAGLAGLDGLLNGVQDGGAVASLALLLLCTTVTAWLIAVRTRRIAVDGAHEAMRVEQASRDIDRLLRGHHDLSSALSAATLDSEELARRLSGEGATGALADDLHGHVARLVEQVSTLKDDAWIVSGALQQPRTDIGAVIRAAVDSHRAQWPGVRFEVIDRTDAPRAIPGGEELLHHIADNLVINACEGDGRRGASRVRVSVEADSGRLDLEVEDDGPGFSRAQLGHPPNVRNTTKRRGSGLGLMLIDRALKRVGGTLHRTNAETSGARVRVELPLG